MGLREYLAKLPGRAELEADGARQVHERVRLKEPPTRPQIRNFDAQDAEPNLQAWKDWVDGGGQEEKIP